MSTAERYTTKRRFEPHPLTGTQVRRRVPTCHEINFSAHVPQVPQLRLFDIWGWWVHVDTAKWRGHAESTSAQDAPRLGHELPQLALR